MTAGVTAVVAVDGGNSKTDVVVVAADGRLLSAVRGPGTNPQVVGMSGAFDTLNGLLSQALARAGGSAGEVRVAHVCACLAGADLPEEEAAMRERLAAQAPGDSHVVLNDTFAVLRAGLDDGPVTGAAARGAVPGIVVVCGAGLNCVAVGRDGRTARFLALGEMSGDWGGGGDVGLAAVWHAARAEDGRGPDTVLRDVVAVQFGATCVRDVVIARYHDEITLDDLFDLTPLVFSAAGAGDGVARSIVTRLADEIAVMAVTAARRAGLAGSPVPLVLGGSLLAARDPVLMTLLEERLGTALPLAETRVVDVPPIVGAALLALDGLGATSGAGRLLRGRFASGVDPFAGTPSAAPV